MNTRSRRLLSAVGLAALAAGSFALADPPRGPVRVTVKEGRIATAEATPSVDANPRIVCQFASPSHFGLTLEGRRICCSPNGSIWSAMRVDGAQIFQAGVNAGRVVQPNQPPRELPPGPGGRKRVGYASTWGVNNLHVTQLIEIVPGKPTAKGTDPDKRKLDTARITYLVENKDTRPHTVEYRVSIDMLVGNNDGALYAAPATQPGSILNGVALEGKTLPPYLWCVEKANFNNPGFVATMTLRGGQGDWPSKVVLTNLGAVGGGNNKWDIPAQPAGDSACAIYWAAKELRPGEKREMVWAYGGGLATDPQPEGHVGLNLAGSFEPGKLFTVLAVVTDPAPSQALTLDLPAGLERVEGREIQPVPPPGPQGTSVVLWKARVLRTGDYAIKVHSSLGGTQVKHVSIQSAE